MSFSNKESFMNIFLVKFINSLNCLCYRENKLGRQIQWRKLTEKLLKKLCHGSLKVLDDITSSYNTFMPKLEWLVSYV